MPENDLKQDISHQSSAGTQIILLCANMLFSAFEMIFSAVFSRLDMFLPEKTRSFILGRTTQNVLQTTQKLKEIVSKTPVDIYWVHIASAGELEQAIPVCEALIEKYDTLGKVQCHFVISYFSPSAMPFLDRVPNLIHSFPLPWDTTRNAERLLKSFSHNLKGTLFVRYEIWPNLLTTLSNHNIPSFLLGALARKTRKGIAAWLSGIVQNRFYLLFNTIFVVDSSDQEYFQVHLGPRLQIQVAGDPKWLRAQQKAERIHSKHLNSAVAQKIHHYIAETGRPLFLFGSPHLEEREVALKLVKHFKANSKSDLESTSQDATRVEPNQVAILVMAPPDIESDSMKTLSQEFSQMGVSAGWVSQLLNGNADQGSWKETLESTDILVVDTMGHLAELYSCAHIAIVGGGFDGQIHNTLEPAAHGVPVLTGPNLSRAPEAETLLKKNAIRSFAKPDELFQFLAACSRVFKPALTEGKADHLPSPAVDLSRQLKMLSYEAKMAFDQIPNTSEVVSSRVLSQTLV